MPLRQVVFSLAGHVSSSNRLRCDQGHGGCPADRPDDLYLRYLPKLTKPLSRRRSPSALPPNRTHTIRHHQKISTVIEGTGTSDGVTAWLDRTTAVSYCRRRHSNLTAIARPSQLNQYQGNFCPGRCCTSNKALTSLYDDCHNGHYNRSSMSNTTSGLYGIPASSPRHINDQNPILVDTGPDGSQVDILLWKGDVPLIVA